MRMRDVMKLNAKDIVLREIRGFRRVLGPCIIFSLGICVVAVVCLLLAFMPIFAEDGDEEALRAHGLSQSAASAIFATILVPYLVVLLPSLLGFFYLRHVLCRLLLPLLEHRERSEEPSDDPSSGVRGSADARDDSKAGLSRE